MHKPSVGPIHDALRTDVRSSSKVPPRCAPLRDRRQLQSEDARAKPVTMPAAHYMMSQMDYGALSRPLTATELYAVRAFHLVLPVLPEA